MYSLINFLTLCFIIKPFRAFAQLYDTVLDSVHCVDRLHNNITYKVLVLTTSRDILF